MAIYFEPIRQAKAVNVSVGITAVQINTPTNTLPGFKLILIYNNSASTKAYVGSDSAVTIANGYPLLAGKERAFGFENAPLLDIYMIADAAATDIRVMFLK